MQNEGFPQLPKPAELPDFGLYMDQVMTLMEKQFPRWPLTKTMINNYTKDKILFPTEKKKYTREHLMMLSLIQILKRTLTLPEIKSVLAPWSKKLEKGEKEDFYALYISFLSQYSDSLKKASALSEDLESNSQNNSTLVYHYALLSSYFQTLAEDQVNDPESL